MHAATRAGRCRRLTRRAISLAAPWGGAGGDPHRRRRSGARRAGRMRNHHQWRRRGRRSLAADAGVLGRARPDGGAKLRQAAGRCRARRDAQPRRRDGEARAHGGEPHRAADRGIPPRCPEVEMGGQRARGPGAQCLLHARRQNRLLRGPDRPAASQRQRDRHRDGARDLARAARALARAGLAGNGRAGDDRHRRRALRPGAGLGRSRRRRLPELRGDEIQPHRRSRSRPHRPRARRARRLRSACRRHAVAENDRRQRRRASAGVPQQPSGRGEPRARDRGAATHRDAAIPSRTLVTDATLLDTPGRSGPPGATGRAGATGAAGKVGAVGAAGAVGAVGAAGVDGAVGAAGVAGKAGLDGAVGATGVDGAAGATGMDGAGGAVGAAGLDGAIGATGLAGVDGTAGAAGDSRINWASGGLALLALTAALYLARAFFVPLLIGILGSYALHPLVDRLQAWRVPRSVGAALVLAILIGSFSWIAVSMTADAEALIEKLPEAARKLRQDLGSARLGTPTALQNMNEAARQLQGAATDAGAGRASSKALAPQAPEATWLRDYTLTQTALIVTVAAQTPIVLLLTYFLLASGVHFRRKLVQLVGPTLSRKKDAVRILEEIDVQVQRYLFAMLASNALVGFGTWLAFLAFGVEQAGVWGIAAGVLHFIPYLGPALIALGSGVAAFLQFGSFYYGLAVAGVSLVVAGTIG